MSISNSQQVRPYAGIEDVRRVGTPVERCAERVARFGFVSKQMMLVQAGKMSSIANWEFKAGLGRGIWKSALHWGMWRERIGELRGHEHQLDRLADSKLSDLFEELLWSENDLEFAAGLYDFILPAYREALLRYIQDTNPLVDHPTVRLARHVLLDIEEHIAFGQSVLQSLADDHADKRVPAWRDHLETYLEAAGGLDGTGEERPSFELPPPRSRGEFRFPPTFARDERFTTTTPKLNPFNGQATHDKLLAMMWVRSQEMTAAELIATVIFEWDDLPYEGYLDLARHCWDETRHCLFGQAALEDEGISFESLPNWVGYAGHTLPAPAPKRYSHLAIATEATLMRHPGGKRGEWEWCRDRAKHPLMTTYQDFDWADEVNHVRFGREWLVRYFWGGDRAKAQAMADETMAERVAYYEKLSTGKDDSDLPTSHLEGHIR